MNEFNIAVGCRVRNLREARGWTREKLAEYAKMSDKYLYEIEAGKKGLSAYKMLSLANVLGVTMDYLAIGEHGKEEYKAIKVLLHNFTKSEVKKIEAIIQNIVEIK